jgi:hypothetical protein
MSSSNVIIYEREGADFLADRIVTEYEGSRSSVVAADPSAIVTAAVDAVDHGADQIELCGGLGRLWHAKVLEAVGDRVPVGAVTYAFESLTGVADYKARWGKEFQREAFIYIQPGADPTVDRAETETEDARTYLVAVPDAAAAPAVATQLVDEDGVQLIELYGGFQPGDTARVIEAIDARAPVGVSAAAGALTPSARSRSAARSATG